MDGKDSRLNQAMAAEIRGERVARDLTQERLAEASGISYSTIKRIERGKVDISTGDLGAIASVFSNQEPEVGPHQLMERAVTRAGGYETLLSVAASKTDDLHTKRKQNEARAMTVEQIESQQHAATRDPELDTDEPPTS